MGLLAAGFLALFLPLAAIIVVLYLLKIKRRDQVVPTTFLWQKVTSDIQASQPWQRLRPSWLLTLQLLALALLAAAGARPFMHAVGLAGQDIVVIIDNSASMAATDVKGSRLEEAKRQSVEIAKGLGRGDRMLVIAASQRTLAVSSLTAEKQTAIEAINRIPQTELSSNLTDAVQLALGGSKGERPLDVVVFSDGTVSEPNRSEKDKDKVRFIKIGRYGRNAAISLFRTETVAGATSAFARVANLSDQQLRVPVTLRLGTELIDVREATIDAGKSTALEFDLPDKASGRLVLSLNIKDDLDADNTAYGFAGSLTGIKTLVVGPGNVFLEQALALDRRLVVDKASAAPTSDLLAKYDIVIWDRVNGTSGAKGAEWFIASDAPYAPARLSEKKQPSVVIWGRKAPISRYADLASMRYRDFRALSVADWGDTLAEAGSAPIIAAGESNQGRRFLVFGFDFLASDLPLRVTFPILVGNATSWLTDETQPEMPLTPGQTVRLPVDAGSATTVTSPDKQQFSLPKGQNIFTQTSRTGLYEWVSGKQNGAFSVNLNSVEESRLQSDAKTVKKQTGSGNGRPPKTNREVYGWFVLVALAVLASEWMVFHRRL